jgi:hypothetical protein
MIIVRNPRSERDRKLRSLELWLLLILVVLVNGSFIYIIGLFAIAAMLILTEVFVFGIFLAFLSVLIGENLFVTILENLLIAFEG